MSILRMGLVALATAGLVVAAGLVVLRTRTRAARAAPSEEDVRHFEQLKAEMERLAATERRKHELEAQVAGLERLRRPSLVQILKSIDTLARAHRVEIRHLNVDQGRFKITFRAPSLESADRFSRRLEQDGAATGVLLESRDATTFVVNGTLVATPLPGAP